MEQALSVYYLLVNILHFTRLETNGFALTKNYAD
jgi:hypothetical protein